MPESTDSKVTAPVLSYGHTKFTELAGKIVMMYDGELHICEEDGEGYRWVMIAGRVKARPRFHIDPLSDPILQS